MIRSWSDCVRSRIFTRAALALKRSVTAPSFASAASAWLCAILAESSAVARSAIDCSSFSVEVASSARIVSSSSRVERSAVSAADRPRASSSRDEVSGHAKGLELLERFTCLRELASGRLGTLLQSFNSCRTESFWDWLSFRTIASASFSLVRACSWAERSSCTTCAASATCLAACSAATVAAAVRWSTSAAMSRSSFDEGRNVDSSAWVVASKRSAKAVQLLTRSLGRSGKKRGDRRGGLVGCVLAEVHSSRLEGSPTLQPGTAVPGETCPIPAPENDRRIRSGNYDSVIVADARRSFVRAWCGAAATPLAERDTDRLRTADRDRPSCRARLQAENA